MKSPASARTENDHTRPRYVSTTNACKLCTPLGASLAFQGIEGAIPFLHGSQGCATYMRRYVISHFREPIDIASSSLGEKHAVYGGAANLKQGLRNVIRKYHPALIGIATTCLTETIGDDVPMALKEFRAEAVSGDDPVELPYLVAASTPSYNGTHMDGFHSAIRAVVSTLADGGPPLEVVNVLPGFCSSADARYLKEIVEAFGLVPTLLPDFSEKLDGPALTHYEKIPAGGTPIASIRAMGRSLATLELGRVLAAADEAGGPAAPASVLEEKFGVKRVPLGLPIGLRESDAFFHALEDASGNATPPKHRLERGQLIDAYVDGHKYLFGKRAVVYGEEDLVVGLTAFLVEVGIRPVLCASGGKSGRLIDAIADVTEGFLAEAPTVIEGADFHEIGEEAADLKPDLIVGNSKGYALARKLGIPIIRVGFPIHDRFGAQRTLHYGYRGAQSLFDRIVNAVLEKNQESSPVGYCYL